MAGGDPRSGGSTAIHTVIVPLRMNFVAGGQDTSALDNLGWVCYHAAPLNYTFVGTNRVQDVLNSPVFAPTFTTPTDMGGDTAQVGDAFVRAQWNSLGTGYHTRLVNDSVLPTQTIDLPANKGLAYQRPVGAWREANGFGPTNTITGVADYGWFSARLQNLINSLHISSTTVPIFLTDNVLLYITHEVSEFLDDPFVNNAVQPWQTPTAPQYGCSGVLEVGDPVVGLWFPYDGNTAQAPTGTTYYGQYHPEDEVFAQWFGRGGIEPVLGPSWDGRLTFMGPRTTGLGGPYAGFGSYAQGC